MLAIRSFTAPLLDYLLPQHCVICREPVAADDTSRAGWPMIICRWCRAALPGIDALRCPVCGLRRRQRTRCAECRRQPPPFSATLVLGDYAHPLDELIRHFKYRRRTDLGRAFGQIIAEQVLFGRSAASGPAPTALPTPQWPALIVPVPLTAARLRRRGFNQAAVLAGDLSRRLGVPIARQVLLRQAASGKLPTSQTIRSRAARLAAVAGQFKSGLQVAGKHVVLVDDVMTTAATAGAAAAALRAGGAARVTVVVVARTGELPGSSGGDAQPTRSEHHVRC